MKKLLSILLTALLIISCIAVTGCSKKTEEPINVIRIGGIGPLTGSASKYGTSVRNGAMIAIDEINAMGGVQFELNFMNDKNDGGLSRKAYDKLMEWDMHVLLGSATTDPCLEVASLAARDKIFTVTPSASAPEITEGKDNVFRVCFNDNGQGKAAASYIAANALTQGIAVFYTEGDVYSEGVYEAFKAEVERLELDIVYTAAINEDETDFTSHLTEAMEAGADLLFLPIYYEPASMIITQASDMDYLPLFFGTDGLDGILSVDGFDTSLAEGVHLLTSIPADYTDVRTRQFMESYQEAYGEVATQFAADAYDAVYAIYEAVKASGVTPDMTYSEMCPLLQKAMTEISLKGITSVDSSLTWSADGEVKKSPMVVIIRDGSYFAG